LETFIKKNEITEGLTKLCTECGVNPVETAQTDEQSCTDCLDIASEGALRPTQVLDFHDQDYRAVRFNPFPDALQHDLDD